MGFRPLFKRLVLWIERESGVQESQKEVVEREKSIKCIF